MKGTSDLPSGISGSGPIRLQTELFAYVFPSSVGQDALGKVKMRWKAEVKPFASTPTLKINGAQSSVHVVQGAFNRDECERIVLLGESGARVVAEVEKGYAAMRTSELTWVQPSTDTHWLYHRIGLLFLEANRAYQFDLVGLQEPLQFSRYSAGGRFDWHVDMGGRATAGRKLSLSIQLTDSSQYDGGDLGFLSNAGKGARERGAAIIFPSFLAHRVAPVTQGLRHALIAWAYGPSFV